MSQGSPYTCLLTETFYITDIPVCKGPELFYDIFLFIGIFIGTNVYTRTTENRLIAFQVFLEQSIHESISFGIEQIQMIHAIFFTTQFRLVMTESQRMCRSIYLRYDFDELGGCIQLKIYEFLFGIITVAGCQSGEGFTFQTESGIRFIPIMTEELLETVIVQMYLENIHLVVRHHLDQIAQVSHRNELTTTVHHKATYGVIRPVTYLSFRYTMILCLFTNLE